jgi:hypothetical protein
MQSRSLLMNTTSYTYSSVINPVGYATPTVQQNAITSTDTLSVLNKIETYYTRNMADLSYSDIPNNYINMMQLYTTVLQTYNDIADTSVKLLLKITGEGLIGSLNAATLNNSNHELDVILNQKNQQIHQLMNPTPQTTISTTGKLGINKIFKLPPLFSIYISLYGMPERGQGFDSIKMTQLLATMEKYGIDPYN